MTLQELFDQIGNNPTFVVVYFLLLPLLAFMTGMWSENEGHLKPWKYIYSALIYLVCVPGIFAVVLCLYTFFFERQSFLNVNVLVYFLPIISMIATIVLVRRSVNLNAVPGFGKLSGLLMMITVTLIAMLFIQKTRIWVVFVGSFFHLLILFVVLFAIFMFGWRKLLNSK